MASKGFFNAFADVWMHEGVRTPKVDYCGALGHISPTDLGIKAAREALKRAGIAATEIGSVITGNMAPGEISMELHLTGPNTCLCTACAAGSHAVADTGGHGDDGAGDEAADD